MSINICELTVPVQLRFKKAVESVKCLCSFLKGHNGYSVDVSLNPKVIF